MDQNQGQLNATRTTQIWAGAVCAVVLIALISGHLLTLRDRSLVASAIADANHFRSALAAYEVDYGTFPGDTVSNPFVFAHELRDPQGRPYIHLPSEKELTGFTYTPDEDGDGYTIVIHARDRKNTPVVANPASASAHTEG
jgi:hypothetical protein